MPQNIKGPEREILGRLGFPIPVEVEQSASQTAIRAMAAVQSKLETTVQEEEEPWVGQDDRSIPVSDGTLQWDGRVSAGAGVFKSCGVVLPQQVEECDPWEMFLPLSEGDPQSVPKAMIASCDGIPRLHKAEVAFTKGIESLLSSLATVVR